MTTYNKADRHKTPVSLDARQQADMELLLKRGWVDAPPKAGVAHAKQWGEFRSKEELLAALPPLPAYEPPDADE